MRDLTDQTEKEILCSYLDSKSIVLEIGSYDGASALAMSEVAKDVLCIDPFEEDHTLGSVIRPSLGSFLAATKEKDNIHLCYARDNDILPLLKDRAFHFVFIDGLHTYAATLYDLLEANRLVKLGGQIALHDYSFPEVKRAINVWVNKFTPYNREVEFRQAYLDRLIVWEKVRG